MSLFYVERECWQRFPKVLIMVRKDGRGDERRRYVPERTCRLVYDPVHLDYVCSACGEWRDTPLYDARDADDALVCRDYRFCPHCGARVVDDR